MSEPNWKEYEATAREILERLSRELDIDQVNGESKLTGNHTDWNVEGTVTCLDQEGILILECRRHTTRGVDQESLGGLAYRIQDTGSTGGIIITPLPLQAGAQKIAKAENIIPIQLPEWSTAHNYLATVLEKTIRGVGITDSLSISGDVVSITVKRVIPD